MSGLLISLLILVLHALVSAFFMRRKVILTTHWKMPWRSALVGQLTLSVLAFGLAFVTMTGMVKFVKMLDQTFSLMIFSMFLLMWGLGQALLIPKLAENAKHRFIAPWTMREIWFTTVTWMVLVYTCIGAIVLGTLLYRNHGMPPGKSALSGFTLIPIATANHASLRAGILAPRHFATGNRNCCRLGPASPARHRPVPFACHLSSMETLGTGLTGILPNQ